MKLIIEKCDKLYGEVRVPGDKSITHRALMIGAIARGKTIIENYSNCKDCITTLNILKKIGVTIEKKEREIIIYGGGFSGLTQPEEILDCENSGTTIRLLAGIFSTLNFKTILTGDSSLKKRPMDRIILPLSKMGADIKGEGDKGFPPIIIHGKNLTPVDHILNIPSAQVKTALIFAALNTFGEIIIEEKISSRDHTEKMLQIFGANISIGKKNIIIKGKSPIFGTKVKVPGDISSAAYFIALALLIDKSEIIINDVGINKTRIGFLNILKRMGARIEVINKKTLYNEPVADIIIKGKQKLTGVMVKKVEVPFVIDELPLLAVVATQAEGYTIVKGAEELRVKESDRIKSITEELKKLGGKIRATEDGFIVEGKTSLNGAVCESHGDHRIAMSLAVAGFLSEGKTVINNSESIDVSFPGFKNYFKELNCERIIGV